MKTDQTPSVLKRWRSPSIIAALLLTLTISATVSWASPNTPHQYSITIHAAGTPLDGVYPKLQLWVNSQFMTEFDQVYGNPNNNEYQQLSYAFTINKPIERVRVTYVNDWYTPGHPEDRNVKVDKIVINGVSYQTEHLAVYSEGSYSPISGCGGGRKYSEWLHCNGFFEYPISDIPISTQSSQGGLELQPLPEETVTPTPTVTPTAVPTPTLTQIPTPSPTIVAPTPTPKVLAASQTSGGYTTGNGQLYHHGKQIYLHGVNWFGFETGTHAAHGLWARNWKEMIQQIKSTGFNAVRIPVCPDSLRNVGVDGVDTSLNPDLAGKKSLDLMTMIMDEFNRQQIYIVLDHHRPDCNSQSDLWYTDSYSEQQWINDLTFMANRFKNLPYFVGIDLKNEPRNSATWGTGNQATDWNLAAERAGRAVLQANPNLVIFVQGIHQNPTCSGTGPHFWGENLEPLNCVGINENSIPKNKLVLSPHIYGPDVYVQGYMNDSSFPQNMTAIWEKHFGFATTKGYTLIPGEWGGRYGNGGDHRDVIWHDTLVDYFIQKKICSTFYWSWNPNSGDTGGILQDDWKTVWSNKAQLMNRYFSSCK